MHENLALKRILALETRVINVFLNEGNCIIRTLEKLKPNRIKVNVRLQTPCDAPVTYMDIGYAILERQDASSPFVVIEKNVKIEPYKDISIEELLITVGGEDANEFLREGYTFYY